MENPFKKMRENILSRKLIALIEDRGPMYFTNKEKDKTYATGTSRYKFREFPSELNYSPDVIDEKKKEIIEDDRAAYVKKIEGLIADGANVNYAGKSGTDKTPLDALCEANENLFIEAAVTQPPSRQGGASFTPEFIAGVRSPAQDIAKVLLKNGAVKLNSEKTFAKNFPELADDLNKSRAVEAAKRAAVHAKGRV